MGTVRIDEDLIGMGLSIDDASKVMEKRREAKALQRRIDAMTDSYEKRITPHVEAIDTIEGDLVELLPEGKPAFPWVEEEDEAVVEGDAMTGAPVEPSEPVPATRLTKVE